MDLSKLPEEAIKNLLGFLSLDDRKNLMLTCRENLEMMEKNGEYKLVLEPTKFRAAGNFNLVMGMKRNFTKIELRGVRVDGSVECAEIQRLFTTFWKFSDSVRELYLNCNIEAHDYLTIIFGMTKNLESIEIVNGVQPSETAMRLFRKQKKRDLDHLTGLRKISLVNCDSTIELILTQLKKDQIEELNVVNMDASTLLAAFIANQSRITKFTVETKSRINFVIFANLASSLKLSKLGISLIADKTTQAVPQVSALTSSVCFVGVSRASKVTEIKPLEIDSDLVILNTISLLELLHEECLNDDSLKHLQISNERISEAVIERIAKQNSLTKLAISVKNDIPENLWRLYMLPNLKELTFIGPSSEIGQLTAYHMEHFFKSGIKKFNFQKSI